MAAALITSSTVILNEPGLAALLDTSEGPIGLFVARKAVEVRDHARANLRDYFRTASSLTVDQDVDFEMDGSDAVVGIKDAGPKSRRMADAQAAGKVNWLLKAVDESKGV